MSDDWTITLRPLPDSVPSVVRLRRALKTLLRRYRLRCTAIEARPPPASDKAPTTKNKLKNSKGIKMPTLTNLFPSKYLKADDLGDRDRVVTIERVELELVGQDKEQKAVVYFKGGTKGLILNQTNARAIAAIAGSEDTDDWTDCQIMLVTAAVDFRGTLTYAIRVKAVPRNKKAAAPPPPDDDDATAIADTETIPF